LGNTSLSDLAAQAVAGSGFLKGSGEMAARIRAHDWAATPLGPIGAWPQSLKTATGLLIASPVPIVMLWGEPGVMLYNDAYSIFAGGRHPQLLGSNVREGWPEVADFNDHVMKVGLAGGTLAYKDQELTLYRTGEPEQVWMDLDYWPVPGEDGEPAGVIATVIETTEKVRADRLRAETNERLELALSAGRGVGTWDWDISADRVVADARFAELYGVDPAVARDGAPLSEFFQAMHPEDAERVGREVQRAIDTRAPFRSEYRLIQTDGEIRWVSAEGRIVTDADGKLRFPGVTFDITERREADAVLAETESRYDALFNSTATGFCIIQMKFDAEMRPVDYMIVEGNPAFEEMTGLKGANGKWVSDIAPGLEQHWFDLYGKVALTGETVRFEQPADIFSRWYDVEAQRIGEPGDRRVAILFNNITDRKLREARQTALIDLDQALSNETDPAAVVQTSSRLLAKALHAHRAGYGDVDPDAETIVVANDWVEPGGRSVAGTHHFRTYGSYIAETIQGRPVTIEDVRTDPRTAADPGPLLAYGIVALMDVPVMENDRMVAQVLVHSATPRVWTPEEIDLARAFAERTRSVVSRRKAERESRAAELHQKALVELNDAIRDLTNSEEIAHASSRILAEALGVSRVGYGVMDTVAETVTIARDYNAPGVQSIAGVIHFRDFGSYIEDLTRGETVIFADAAHDPRVEDGGVALAGIRATALINMPLMERGKVVALLFVNNATPRAWSDEEVALVREVAERVRTASERARAAAELEDSEARYRTLFNEMDEGFCIIEFFDGPHGPDSDYIHVEANPAYAANAGIENVVGQKLREMVGDEAQSWVDRYGEVLRTGKPIRFEQELVATGRWLELSAFRVEPPGRKQVAVLFQDLTARKKAEIALRELNADLEKQVAERVLERGTTWEVASDMLSVIDLTTGRFLRVNPAWQVGLGWDRQTLEGAPYADFVNPEDLAGSAEAFEAVRRGDPVLKFENRYRNAEGAWRWLSWTAVPEGGKLYSSARDVTVEKEQAAALAQAQEALRQSQKMEAVGQLTGGIAHDFNNLLAGISGSLELLGKRLGEGRLNGMDRYIDAAQGSAQRAASLTQRLLAFSRRQTLDPRPTDVNRLIGGMEDLIRRTVGPDVEVEVVGAGGLWTTRIDAPQLENALLNLCINGRDAMAPTGGRLTIETANKWLDDRSARARDLLPGQYVSLCVTDTGTGMTPEIQAQVFDPFFTTKPLGQGTGLGLSMIHGFVRQSGGQVRIYSEVGKGTTMCLYLPRYTGEMEITDEDALEPVHHGGHGETVMVIDDEETVRMLVAEVLGDAGYHVLEATDGPSGLDVLRSEARIDLLITDVGLPGGMNGRQVADAAREVRPDLKVLFVTGYAENAAVGNGHLDAGMEVMTKPFVMAALGEKVREMIER
jgi:PAS domain S-box-containing protein